MSDPDVDVVEFMLTTKLFNDRRDLDPDDLPPAYRAPFWSDATIERPLTADQGAIASAMAPWSAVSGRSMVASLQNGARYAGGRSSG